MPRLAVFRVSRARGTGNCRQGTFLHRTFFRKNALVPVLLQERTGFTDGKVWYLTPKMKVKYHNACFTACALAPGGAEGKGTEQELQA